MKKSLQALSLLVSFSAIADVQLNNLSKKDVENVTAEFGANFAHTAVAAPETDGIWGVEVGIVGGKTSSPNFSDVIDSSGGKGSDFQSLYHAGLMGRIHLPFDLFAEMTILPEQEISDVKIKNNTFSVGWNAGRSLGLPLDIALGFDYGKGEVNFSQDADATTTPPTPATDINFSTKTTVYWLGVSKSFWIVTPYVKVGQSKIDGELKADADIFGYTASTKENVSLSGTFVAGGINFQLAILKLGVEASQIQDTNRFSGKLSLDF